MAESALLALEAKDMSPEAVEAKVATARFFCEQLLPAVHGLGAAVMGDSGLLMSFQHDVLMR
jgi:hypothetical protein